MGSPFNLQAVVGRKLNEVEDELRKNYIKVRILHPNTVGDARHDLTRLNVSVDIDETITKVDFG